MPRDRYMVNIAGANAFCQGGQFWQQLNRELHDLSDGNGRRRITASGSGGRRLQQATLEWWNFCVWGRKEGENSGGGKEAVKEIGSERGVQWGGGVEWRGEGGRCIEQVLYGGFKVFQSGCYDVLSAGFSRMN
ncbi:hypothetical protein BaRGS_00008288 [Batillaria attramentaria]|uniref:Uncharacterized protein n=1 Tax=Batillaria attramentaria TaxID=370345 RepID=A0ABD0LLF8_9CAEN